MDKQTIRLLKKEIIASGTMAFTFTKPDGFDYKPGQSIDLTLINPPETDAEGNTRAFSLTSAPRENTIGIATRMRDTAFKRVLKNSDINSEFEFAGPFGSFTLHNNASRPAVFLVGGIGITPFFSILKNAAAEKLTHKIFLFYSNRKPEDSAFLNELSALQTEIQDFTLIASMTEMENSLQNWNGETGFITKEMILKYAGDLTNAVCYSAGPPQMVAAMRKILNGIGVNDDDIRTEEFSGY
ncbi:MAG: FAD-dependent oxidoreductase [Bacteroidetes bacterium]|nr:FAD-dependent oxidoreductase [Bacteroidota bacterium]